MVRHTKHIKYKSYDYYWHLNHGWSLIEVIDDMATIRKDID